jgi:hypothetical protein
VLGEQLAHTGGDGVPQALVASLTLLLLGLCLVSASTLAGRRH